MPIPKPISNETEETYISRCMEAIGSEYDSPEQGLAVCYTQFKTAKGTRLSVSDRITLYLNYMRRKTALAITPPNLNIYGYHTRFFQICPGAQATFEHIMTMDNDDDTIGMIRSLAQIADNIFRIEDEVMESQSATPHQYEEAVILVDDFKDLMGEVDKISGMKHDVDYMNGHLIKIKEYLNG